MSGDPFLVLGIEPRFDLDPKELDQKVRALGRALHPDRHAGSSASERRMALSKSIDVNDAHRLLKDPVRRAEVLRKSIPSPEATSASPELLMEMMELREGLSDARRKQDLKRVRELAATVKAREATLLDNLSKGFQSALADPSADPTSIDESLSELRYVRRFLDEVNLIEDEL